MIERVAKAMAGEADVTDYFRWKARLAIAAMREPTEAVIAALYDAMGAEGAHDCEVRPRDIWCAGIDEALR